MAHSLEQQLNGASAFAHLSDAEWVQFCADLAALRLASADFPARGPQGDQDLDRFWSPLLEKLWRGVTANDLTQHLTAEAVANATQIYRDLSRASHARHHVLRLLAASGERTSRDVLATNAS